MPDAEGKNIFAANFLARLLRHLLELSAWLVAASTVKPGATTTNSSPPMRAT